jgi:hypothetical protein
VKNDEVRGKIYMKDDEVGGKLKLCGACKEQVKLSGFKW